MWKTVQWVDVFWTISVLITKLSLALLSLSVYCGDPSLSISLHLSISLLLFVCFRSPFPYSCSLSFSPAITLSQSVCLFFPPSPCQSVCPCFGLSDSLPLHPYLHLYPQLYLSISISLSLSLSLSHSISISISISIALYLSLSLSPAGLVCIRGHGQTEM